MVQIVLLSKTLMFMDKDLIKEKLHKDELYQIIDSFKYRKITPVKFYSILLNKVHPFYDGNGRTSKKLFTNYDKIIKVIDRTNN